jgi:hypothetical protein
VRSTLIAVGFWEEVVMMVVPAKLVDRTRIAPPLSGPPAVADCSRSAPPLGHGAGMPWLLPEA